VWRELPCSAHKMRVYFLNFCGGDLSKSGVGVLNQHDKVVLIPGTGLWRRFEGIAVTTEAIVSGGRGVGGTVRLSSGLGPNDCIDQARPSVGRGVSAEPGTIDVAPVTPSAADVLTTRTTLVNDKCSVPTSGPQGWSESFDVVNLVVVRVGGSDRVRRRSAEGVVIGNVCFEIQSVRLEPWGLQVMLHTGGETAEGLWGARILIDLGEKLTGGSQVGGPSEPSSVTGVDVHANVECRQLLDSVDNTLFICCLCAGTLRPTEVGDNVGQRIGLDDGDNSNRWVLFMSG